MSFVTPKLGLLAPEDGDDFVTEDIAANLQKIDASPGNYICTSTTRPNSGGGAPAWGAQHAGRKITESNTGLEWLWNGSAFVRTAGTGLLRLAAGGQAFAIRATNYQQSAETYGAVIGLTNVIIPAGNRPIQMCFDFYGARGWSGASSYEDGDGEEILFRFHQSLGNGNSPIGRQILWGSNGNKFEIKGGSITALFPSGFAPGNYNFSIQVRAVDVGAPQSWAQVVSGPDNATNYFYITEL